jgi:MarR family transcriptional regulator for hemolysin
MRAMPTLESLRLSVSTALVIASRKWRRTVHEMLSAYNISEACATPLVIAGRLGAPVRQVVLAEMMRIEGPSLVDDRRAKIISLTDEGRAVTEKVEKQLVGLRANVLKGFTRTELETALRVLGAFNTADSADTTLAPRSTHPGAGRKAS